MAGAGAGNASHPVRIIRVALLGLVLECRARGRELVAGFF